MTPDAILVATRAPASVCGALPSPAACRDVHSSQPLTAVTVAGAATITAVQSYNLPASGGLTITVLGSDFGATDPSPTAYLHANSGDQALMCRHGLASFSHDDHTRRRCFLDTTSHARWLASFSHDDHGSFVFPGGSSSYVSATSVLCNPARFLSTSTFARVSDLSAVDVYLRISSSDISKARTRAHEGSHAGAHRG